MQDLKGRIALILFILSGIIALSGCAHKEAPGDTDGVSGALFLSENEGDSGGAAESSSLTAVMSAEDAMTTAVEVTGIPGAQEESGDQAGARELDAEKCAELQDFLNEDGSYGFLLSIYDRPEDLDAGQVFYIGAGLELAEVTKEERQAYLEQTGREEAVNLFKLTAQQVNDYLQYRAGISVEELSVQPDWVYIEEYDSYYICHGDEDTNICTFEVLDAAVQGNYYRIHYRAKREAADLDGWHIPVYEAVIKKNGDTYRFCENRLWMEQDLLLEPYRTMETASGKVISFCSYRPDTDVNEFADITFAVVQDGDISFNLPGMDEKNIREGMIFDTVRAIDHGDYDGDGLEEIIAICKYDFSAEAEGREDELEARVYRFDEDGSLTLDKKLTKEINKKVNTLTISGAANYIKTGSDRKIYESREEAFADELAIVDQEAYDKFALIYINDDKNPELLEIGSTPERGAKIVFYHDGVLEETFVSSDFSYLRKESLVHSSNGTGNLFYDALYVYTGNRLEVYQSGTYGTRDAAVTAYGKDGKPVYSYFWEGSYVTEAGYNDALYFAFDRQRAKTAESEGTMSAEELLAELRK